MTFSTSHSYKKLEVNVIQYRYLKQKDVKLSKTSEIKL